MECCMAKSKSHIAYRSSISGEFVKPAKAKSSPKTTERQHIPNPGRGVSGRGGKGK
jgi:hypothetical protein